MFFSYNVFVPNKPLITLIEFAGYHTALDSFDWMETQGDPLFHRHLASKSPFLVHVFSLMDPVHIMFKKKN